MCGIVGYTGPREAGPILIEGLRRLEYRGYDSAGIALVDEDGDLFVEKRAGKLVEPPDRDRRPDAARGDRPRAHPLGDPRPAERPQRPSRTWTARATSRSSTTGSSRTSASCATGSRRAATRSTSETDTEAIAHLVEEAYQGDLADAVRGGAARRSRAPTRWSSCTRASPSRLVGARQNVPLVVGLGDGRASSRATSPRSSPTPTASSSSRRATSPTSAPTGVVVTDIDGAPRERAVHDHRLDARGRREGRLRPLHAQGDPRAARGAPPVDRRPRHARRPDPGRRSWPALDATFRRATRVELVACGSASYASLVGAAAHPGLDRAAGAGRRSARSSATRRRRSTRTTLVIAVTQSGETADTIAPTRLAREQGCPIVAVTNTVGSAITREADAVLFLQAGPEIAVAASKTFVTQVTTLVDPGRGDRQARAAALGAERRARARRTPCGPCRTPAARALELDAGDRATSRAATSTRAASCSSAAATRIPAALEGALKLKEISYVHAEGYAAGELKHGPISLLDAECPLVAVATRSRIYDKLISNVMEGRARDARVIAVATEGDEPDRALRRRRPAGSPTRTRRSARCSRSSRSSCSPTTRRSRGARTSTSRATWPSR